MKRSEHRILTTHVGSLPRSIDVTDVVFAQEQGRPVEPAHFRQVIDVGVRDAVIRQLSAGIDIISDGEMSKISYATYIKDRLTGFDGDSPRNPPADLEDFPGYLQRLARSGGTPTYRRPRCIGPISLLSLQGVHDDIAAFRAAVASTPHETDAELFLNSASPGVIALFQPNDYYDTHEHYLEALAEGMRHEYEAIVSAGFVLQIDSPDLGLGRHTLFKNRPLHEYERQAAFHVEVLNHALKNCAADRVRMHICWGNYEGPHHHDAPLEVVLPIALRAKPQGLLFESANPRHAHEWTAFQSIPVPDDKILIPGVVDSVTNFIEHPRLVAERLQRFADIVGRERIIAGTDCGFASFAGFGAVDGDIAYAKLGALAEGARIASQRLWGKSA
jgi:5-methyltetrahydropteroyltriglutamate--homocysteine methyltransferase